MFLTRTATPPVVFAVHERSGRKCVTPPRPRTAAFCENPLFLNGNSRMCVGKRVQPLFAPSWRARFYFANALQLLLIGKLILKSCS